MRYKFTGSGIIDIVSTDSSADDRRWQLLSPYQMKNFFPKNNWGWFNEVLSRENEITSLALGYDKFIKRPVIAKTVNYRLKDMQTPENINARRRVLIEQVKILNDLQCPLLPEALDWFTVENIQDPIKYDEYLMNEPMLILDYIPGVSMSWSINFGKFKRASAKSDEDKRENIFEANFNDIRDMVDVQRIGRVSLKILDFIKYLDNRGYTDIALTPDHVLLLKDDVTRFVGIGRICKTVNKKIDLTHINSSKTIYGYSAPELNDWVTGRRENADGKKIMLFSLGVLIHQMVIGTTEFKPCMLSGPSFIYPNGFSESFINGKGRDGRILHNLISRLCSHNETERLDNIEEIERELLLLSSMYISGEEGKKVVSPSLIGRVKTFNSEKLYGRIEDEAGKMYIFNSYSINEMSKENRALFKVGAKVQFEGTDKADVLGRDKSYANAIVVIDDNLKRNTHRMKNRVDEKTVLEKESNVCGQKKQNNQMNVRTNASSINDRRKASNERTQHNKKSMGSDESDFRKNSEEKVNDNSSIYNKEFEKWKSKITNLIEKTFK